MVHLTIKTFFRSAINVTSPYALSRKRKPVGLFKKHLFHDLEIRSQESLVYSTLLYGSVSQRLGTTEFTDLICWNRYWPRSRFFHLDRPLDRFHFALKTFSSQSFIEVPKSQKKKVKRTNKFRQVWVKLICVRKQNDSKSVTSNDFKFSS